MTDLQAPLTRLYPLPARQVPLEGLYLGQNLRAAGDPDRPFVYSNYVISLDGRIAVPLPERDEMGVPQQTSNPRDWRLFQELAVQSDAVLTSGRYLRDYAAGHAQEILNVYDDPRFKDLEGWRLEHGLEAYPALVVISRSLRFPVPDVLVSGGRRVLLVTTENADPERLRDLSQKCEVHQLGKERVEGGRLIARLHSLGCRLVFNSTGPKVQHMLLAGAMIDRMYMTFANRVLGGDSYATIVEGPLFDPAPGYRLNSAYLDTAALDGLGQLFLSYNCA
jgi:riboflavin biosynthesis pyrimidine reductase